MIVALGIGCDGRKTVLGMREGATENTAVVSSLLSELVERGLDFSTPRLYILDGGKALHAAVRRHAGEAAFHSALPGPQETQCGRSLAGRTQSRREAETPERLRDGRVRRCQARAGAAASGTDGPESERGAQPGRRDGRNAHRPQVARAGPTAPNAVLAPT